MLAKEIQVRTISRREVVRRLKISPRQLMEIERQNNIIPINDKMLLLKKRYSFKEFKEIESAAKSDNKSIQMFVRFIMILALVTGSLMITGMIVYSETDESIQADMVKEIPADAQLDRGILSFRRGKIHEARATFQRGMSSDDPEIRQANTYHYIESFKEHPTIYYKLLKNYVLESPESSYAGTAMYQLANSYSQTDSVDQVMKYYSMMIEKQPNHPLTPVAIMQKINIQVRQKKYMDAVQTIRELAEKYPDTRQAPSALFRAAMLLDGKLNQHSAALDIFEMLQKKYPDYNAGKVLMKIGELSHDWDQDGISAALELDNGTSDGMDPWNSP